ncbi:MAG: hypothetical protein JO256_15335 [Alphaproteobacteria bacterium]|nr:hypothetical protein [Alphaproteobacteria bacterium]
MSSKTFSLVAGVIFALVAVLHVLRMVESWPAVIGGWEVPMWLSGAGVLVAGFLSYSGFRLANQSR